MSLANPTEPQDNYPEGGINDEISRNAAPYLTEAMAILGLENTATDEKIDEAKPNTYEIVQVSGEKADEKIDSLRESYLLSHNGNQLRNVEFDFNNIDTTQFFRDIRAFWPVLSNIQSGFLHINAALKVIKSPDGSIMIDAKNQQENTILQCYSLTLREFIENTGYSSFEAAYYQELRYILPGNRFKTYPSYFYYHQDGLIQAYTELPHEHNRKVIYQAKTLPNHGSILIGAVVKHIKGLSTP